MYISIRTKAECLQCVNIIWCWKYVYYYWWNKPWTNLYTESHQSIFDSCWTIYITYMQLKSISLEYSRIIITIPSFIATTYKLKSQQYRRVRYSYIYYSIYSTELCHYQFTAPVINILGKRVEIRVRKLPICNIKGIQTILKKQ